MKHSANMFGIAVLCGTAALCGAPARSADDTAEPMPEVQYETYFEPFTDDPVQRLSNVTPLPPPTPLFKDFDPLEGLLHNVKTSRVALTTRASFSLGVTTVKVGETFRLPFLMHTGPTLTAQTLKIQFDPEVIQAIDAGPADWTGAAITFNNKPDKVEREGKFVAFELNTSKYWTGVGALMDIRFKAVGEGETTIAAFHFDMADDHFNVTPSLVRDGFVRVVR